MHLNVLEKDLFYILMFEWIEEWSVEIYKTPESSLKVISVWQVVCHCIENQVVEIEIDIPRIWKRYNFIFRRD